MTPEVTLEKERVLNLALETLLKQRDEIDSEIAQIRSQLKPRKKAAKKKRKPMSDARKKALSKAAKKRWAKNKKAKKATK